MGWWKLSRRSSRQGAPPVGTRWPPLHSLQTRQIAIQYGKWSHVVASSVLSSLILYIDCFYIHLHLFISFFFSSYKLVAPRVQQPRFPHGLTTLQNPISDSDFPPHLVPGITSGTQKSPRGGNQCRTGHLNTFFMIFDTHLTHFDHFFF